MPNLPLLTTLGMCIVCCIANSSTARASRFVRVEVLLNGKVILEGNASDNGKRDADELWEALKQVKLKATAEFRTLDIAKDAREAAIKSTAPTGERGNVKIVMSYGGVAETRE